MLEIRFPSRRGPAMLLAALAVVVLFALAAPRVLPAQAAALTEPDLFTDLGTDLGLGTEPMFPEGAESGSEILMPTEECHPPSTQEWILIVVGTLAFFVLCFFLLVRVVQGAFIKRDWSATQGRHFGISISFLLSSGAMAGIAYLVTGCLHPQFLVWILFPLALWVIHLLYTLVVVRKG